MINLPEQVQETQYDVATGCNTHRLKDAVEKARQNGWDLQGGVSVCCNGPGSLVYAQALVKTP